MFCVALSCTHVFVCGLSDNLPNIVKCLVLSFSNAETNAVLEVLTGEGFVVTSVCSSAMCFVSSDVEERESL